MNIKKQHDNRLAELIDRLAGKGCEKGKPTKQMIKNAMQPHPST